MNISKKTKYKQSSSKYMGKKRLLERIQFDSKEPFFKKNEIKLSKRLLFELKRLSVSLNKIKQS